MDPMIKAKTLIEAELNDAIVEVFDLTGTKDHVGIMVASDVFKGKMLIDQHQVIMDILKSEFDKDLHAIKLKTMTLEKFKKKKTEA